MGKMQIIARAALTGLGFYALGLVLRTIHDCNSYIQHLDIVAASIGTILCILFVVVCLVFVRQVDRLAYFLVGNEEVLPFQVQRYWEVVSRRLILLLVGLILLATSLTTVIGAVGILLKLPAQARQLFNEMLYSHDTEAVLQMLLVGLVMTVWQVSYLGLIVYLILGTPSLKAQEVAQDSLLHSPERMHDE